MSSHALPQWHRNSDGKVFEGDKIVRVHQDVPAGEWRLFLECGVTCAVPRAFYERHQASPGEFLLRSLDDGAMAFVTQHHLDCYYRRIGEDGLLDAPGALRGETVKLSDEVRMPGVVKTPDDKEFDAMRKVAEILDMLPNQGAVARVLQWVASRSNARAAEAQMEMIGRSQGQLSERVPDA